MGIMQMIAAAGGLDAYLVSKSLRFNPGDTSYLQRTFDGGDGGTKHTFSVWVKTNPATTARQSIFTCGPYTGGTGYRALELHITDNEFVISTYGTGHGTCDQYSLVELRDPTAWYHFVVTFDSTESTDVDRVKFWINGSLQPALSFSSRTYPAENSVLGWDDNDVGRIGERTAGYTGVLDGYLAEFHYIDGTALDADSFGETNATTGQWIPKDCSGDLTYGTNGFYLKFDGTDLGEDSSGNDNDWTANNLVADSGFGNPSLTSGGPFASNDLETMFDGNASTWAGFGAATSAVIDLGGSYSGDFVVKYSLYNYGAGTTTVTFTPGDHSITIGNSSGSAFTSTFTGSNVTTMTFSNPNAYTTGFLLYQVTVDGTAIIYQDKATVDNTPDTPTPFDDEGNGTGNYATLNSLHKSPNTTLSDGSLQLVNTTTWGTTISTIGMSSGKWYAEVTLSGTITYPAFGVSSIDGAYVTSYLGQDADSYVWFAYSAGGLYTAAGYTNQTGDWVVNNVAGDVIGLALDMDNGTLKYYKNGTLLGGGNAFTGITGTQFFATCGYSQTENWNFGQYAFASTPPTGYKALNTYNLDDTTILSGTYEGTADADGPVVWMNATPATLKIDTSDPPTSLVTFSPTTVDPLAGGFKIRNASTNNGSGTTYYWLATTNRAFKYANAQTSE